MSADTALQVAMAELDELREENEMLKGALRLAEAGRDEFRCQYHSTRKLLYGFVLKVDPTIPEGVVQFRDGDRLLGAIVNVGDDG